MLNFHKKNKDKSYQKKVKDANTIVKHRNKFMSSAQHYKKLTEEKEKQQNKQILENEGSAMRTVKICRANSGIEKENVEEVEDADSMQDAIEKTV